MNKLFCLPKITNDQIRELLISRRGFVFQMSATFLPGGYVSAKPSAMRQSFWYCPMALDTEHRVRIDYVTALTDDANWRELARRISVLKLFIEPLLRGPEQLSDDDLRSLVKVCERYNLEAAFEVGGVRIDSKNYGRGSGRRYARLEAAALRRWELCGGKVTHITFDNAVMNSVSRICRRDPSLRNTNYNPRLAELVVELVDAAAEYRSQFGTAKIGLIESLGYFSFNTDRGTRLKNLDPSVIPDISFSSFLEYLVSCSSRLQVKIDHFHYDFGYEGALFDGNNGRLSFERVAVADRLVQKIGMKTGMIIGAFDDYTLRHSHPPNDLAANVSAVANTKIYLSGFLNSGIAVDQILFDRWEPFPSKVGPALDGNTDMGLTRLLLNETLSSVRP